MATRKTSEAKAADAIEKAMDHAGLDHDAIAHLFAHMTVSIRWAFWTLVKAIIRNEATRFDNGLSSNPADEHIGIEASRMQDALDYYRNQGI